MASVLLRLPHVGNEAPRRASLLCGDASVTRTLARRLLRTKTERPDPLVARFRILRGSESPHVRVADAPSSFISGASLTGVTAAAAAVVAERTGSSGH